MLNPVLYLFHLNNNKYIQRRIERQKDLVSHTHTDGFCAVSVHPIKKGPNVNEETTMRKKKDFSSDCLLLFSIKNLYISSLLFHRNAPLPNLILIPKSLAGFIVTVSVSFLQFFGNRFN